jgi:hypothetical protein
MRALRVASSTCRHDWWQLPPPRCGGAGPVALTAAPGRHPCAPLLQASITTRKGGKRLAIWDLNISLEWAATSDSSGKEVRGRGAPPPPQALSGAFMRSSPACECLASRRPSRGRPDTHLHLHCLATFSFRPQIKGAIDVKEISSAHDDPDDILFEFSVEGAGADHDTFKAVAASLKPQILGALQEFGQRLHGLE